MSKAKKTASKTSKGSKASSKKSGSVRDIAWVEKWLKENSIADVEVLVSDFAGISRGKVMPTSRFLDGLLSNSHRVPDSIFGLTVNCEFAFSDFVTDREEDLYLIPDLDTIRVVPWHEMPTACIICDPIHKDGTPANFAPRQVLRNVLNLYAAQGWKPIVAPEYEFFLIARQDKIESPPVPPRGRSGKVVWDTGELSIDGLEEFSHIFSDIHRYSNIMDIPIHTLAHEAGPAQFEFNIAHGYPLEVADQSFVFKRLIKQTAIRHGMFASFMAKPYPEQFGSAMHIHQSVVDLKTGKNIFANKDGSDSDLFMNYIGGMQQYIPALMAFLAPYGNSYLRICDRVDAPVNTHWGRENRSTGFRVPTSGPEARRLENRIAGADVNPYLAFAASLLAGYIGMEKKLEPTDDLLESAYELDTMSLPQHLFSSLDNLEECEELQDYLGEDFITTYINLKIEEYTANMNVLSPWDIRYLLLNI